MNPKNLVLLLDNKEFMKAFGSLLFKFGIVLFIAGLTMFAFYYVLIRTRKRPNYTEPAPEPETIFMQDEAKSINDQELSAGHSHESNEVRIPRNPKKKNPKKKIILQGLLRVQEDRLNSKCRGIS
jgi:hypothetical protein